jgi:glycosyltransferase involved in cell wall biosynthesis
VARALAHGCVVVTNDLRGTAEYLAPAYAVTTREPGEVFDEAVLLLQGAPEELREKSRLAREFAQRELSVGAVGAVLAEVLAR